MSECDAPQLKFGRLGIDADANEMYRVNRDDATLTNRIWFIPGDLPQMKEAAEWVGATEWEVGAMAVYFETQNGR